MVSVIDHGCGFKGHLTFVGTLVLNGKLQGELSSTGTVIVAETAELEADAQVGTAIISGKFSGHLIARERIELRATARIFGDIATPALVLEEGVVFDGHCKMRTEEPQGSPGDS